MPRIRWSKERIISEIQCRHKLKKPLNYQAVVEDDEKLTGAARRYFGSWDNAMVASGFDVDFYKNPKPAEIITWDRDKVLTELRNRLNEGLDMSAHSVQKDFPKLYGAAISHFGSFKNAMKSLGVDYKKIKKTREWNGEKVIEEIKRLYELGVDLSDNTVAPLNPSLYGAAQTHFGGWKNAIESSDINYESVSRTRRWNRERLIEFVQRAYDVNVNLSQLTRMGIIYNNIITDHFNSVDELLTEAGIPEEDRFILAGTRARSAKETTVVSRIKQYRESMGWSQTELGRRVGRTGRWVGLIESGSIVPLVVDAIILARELNKKVEDLFEINE